MTTEHIRVDADKLKRFSSEVFQKVGVSEEDAQLTANVLVETNLRGVDTHGVLHLARYSNGIKDGLINAKPDIKVFSQAPGTATMEGDRGLGHVVGHRAMIEAMNRAEKQGASFIAVRNSNHFGPGAYYAMMALERDMIGVAMTSTGGVGTVAPGSNKAAVGSNPIAVAAPAGNKTPFVLDMAISVVANNKLEIARREGKSIPEGWAIDGEGKPLTDPTKRVRGEGGLLPLGGTPALGGYKGFGLGVLVDILCSLLSGATARILLPSGIGGTTTGIDHFFGALRIDSFLPLENFKKSMDEMIGAIEALPTLPGFKKIYAAGGYEAEVVKERTANGIPLHRSIIDSLKELSTKYGVEYNL